MQWDKEAEAEFKYEHALYTDGVVSQIVPEQWREAVRGAAGRHHRPTNHLERVVSLADRLSAGERADSGDKQPKQLQSIFCSLTGLDTPAPKAKYLPLKKLAIAEDVIFPSDEIDDSHKAYEKLWDGFLAEAQLLKAAHEKNGNLAVYVDSLLNLMQQYTWCIPSAYYQSVPDVSLYDHSRMTAALAACLVDLPGATVQQLLNEKSDEPVALLVGGDISGVQDFIYTITSQGAAGGLRGRSMYLQLLTEVVARYLLDEMGLPRTNVVYASGGHFFLLAPLSAAETLAEVQKTVSRILLHHHGGDLYLALAVDAIHANEFAGDRFRGRWDSLQKKLQRQKEQKFIELKDELTGVLFEPKEHGGNEEKMCAVCQREHPDTRPQEGTRKCPVCAGFEALGKDLRKARYLTLTRLANRAALDPQKPAGDWRRVLAHFGYRAEVSQTVPVANGQPRTVLALKDEAMAGLKPDEGQSVGRQLLVNVTPVVTGDEWKQFKAEIDDLPPVYDHEHPPVKSFEMMTRQSRGIKRLGILRMDVDNLGNIIGQGLGDRLTLSRLATLSFSLSLFFEGWMEVIAEEVNQTGRGTKAGRKHVNDDSDLVYSIYSGGDDLFFVGAWDLMPRLADRIRRDLAGYACEHPGIHVSGGIALIPGKYPLYQAADDAAEAESKAKSLRRENGERKNALAFLGQVIPWEKFDDVQKYADTLLELVEPDNGKKAVPRQLLRRLEELYIEFNETRQKQA
ncbi:MAG: type III-A CRISPR-associated protein Cas10/Csm1, partial [Chloroflexi bacterium]